MAVDERARRDLYDRLADSIGGDAAETLMAYLPPLGWSDVATKQDLARFEERFDQRFDNVRYQMEALEHRLTASLRGDMAAQTRTLMFSTISMMLVLASTILAAVKL